MKKHLKRLSVFIASSVLFACSTNPNPSSLSQESHLSTTEASSQTSSTESEKDQNVILLETNGELIKNEFEGLWENVAPGGATVYNNHFYFSVRGRGTNSISYTAREYKLDLNNGNLTLIKGYPQSKVRVSDFIEFNGVLYEAITDLQDPSIRFRILADDIEIWTGFSEPQFFVVDDHLLFEGVASIEGQKTDVVCRINPDHSITTLVQSGQDGLGHLFPSPNLSSNRSKVLFTSTKDEKNVYVLVDANGYEIVEQPNHVIYESLLLEDDIFVAYSDRKTPVVVNGNDGNANTDNEYVAISLSTKEVYPVHSSFKQLGNTMDVTAVDQSILFYHPKEEGVWKGTLNNQGLVVRKIPGLDPERYFEIYPIDEQRALFLGFDNDPEGKGARPIFYLVNIK